MKTIYTILFFLDLLVLIMLSYFLLKLVDTGGHGWLTIIVLLGLIGSIMLLATFLGRYIKPHK
jgi:ABC-type enterochelin transport system permease subunit